MSKKTDWGRVFCGHPIEPLKPCDKSRDYTTFWYEEEEYCLEEIRDFVRAVQVLMICGEVIDIPYTHNLEQLVKILKPYDTYVNSHQAVKVLCLAIRGTFLMEGDFDPMADDVNSFQFYVADHVVSMCQLFKPGEDLDLENDPVTKAFRRALEATTIWLGAEYGTTAIDDIEAIYMGTTDYPEKLEFSFKDTMDDHDARFDQFLFEKLRSMTRGDSHV